MKREAKILKNKAIDSLILSIEHFNRADDRGRVSSVLILMDHAFEMLLKACIIHKGGKIRLPREKWTIGFEKSLNIATTNKEIKFLTENQAITLQTINGIRDAVQHYYLDISEQQLYMHAQTGVTLFRDILKKVSQLDLNDLMPGRVLPISSIAPSDITMLFDSETEEIKKLLKTTRRKKSEAFARLRPLAILDASLKGEKVQPSNYELGNKGKQLLNGKSWHEVFSGASAIEFTSNGSGQAFSIHVTKKEGVPVQYVPEGTPGATLLALRQVNDTDVYSLIATKLAKHVGLSVQKTVAVIWYLGIQKDPELFKEISIGKSKHKCYSPKAVDVIKNAIKKKSVDEIWTEYKVARRRK